MQLRFQAGADDWVKWLCADLSTQIKILGLKSVGKERQIAHFVDISLGKENTREVRQWLEKSPSITKTELTELSGKHMMGVVVARDCKACSSIMGYDSAMFVSSAATEQDCSVDYKLFLSDEGVPLLLRRLTKDGVGYRISEIAPISPESPLTSRQLGILKSAVEMGLYDFPRRITQTELAEKLGIKSSTLNEILRSVEKNILGNFLNQNTEIDR